ncbi:MAG: helix-turn-helix domain-containing protein [Proteobacteria bacterium]|nr:helix-turn-helix domain-containing protein [Pseudomonadota bacterium]
MQFTIGHVARSAGCTVQAVRYYEQAGLLPRPERSNGNQRLYGNAEIRRLTFIRHARELGFTLDAIRDLLSLSDSPERSCEAADAIARAQLIEVERRIENLKALKIELRRMVAQCSGGRISDCRVIEVLSDHAKCTSHGSVGGPDSP